MKEAKKFMTPSEVWEKATKPYKTILPSDKWKINKDGAYFYY